jgi:hypothetical protein
MNPEEIELDLSDVWEVIDTYVQVCGAGAPPTTSGLDAEQQARVEAYRRTSDV